MDGTLLSSIAAAERIWRTWCEAHGVDFEALLPRLHGVRAVDTIRSLGLAGIDAEREAALIGRAEIEDVVGVVPLDGVLAFLAGLPGDRWALVTSAPLELAESRMRAAGITMPRTVIAAEDVIHGKPAPDCFLLAAERLGVDAQNCLIFEDSPAGLAAARASGADVIVVTATHAAGHTSAESIRSYDELSAEADGKRITLSRRPRATRRDDG